MIKEDLIEKGMSEEEAECLIKKSKSSLQAHFVKEGIETSVEDYFNIELGSLRELAREAKEEYVRLKKALIELQEGTRKAREHYEALDMSLAFLDGRYRVIESKEKKKKKSQELSREDLLDILASLEEEEDQ